MNNRMEMTFPSFGRNEAFARMVIGAFLVQADPSMGLISEVRTAVSEAVTNAVVHGYKDADGVGKIVLRASIDDSRLLRVEVEDFGRGIENVEQAMQPFYTSEPDKERTGMGFTLMQSFMDALTVHSEPGKGTLVHMEKRLEEF